MFRLRASLILALLFFSISFISALCEEGQIDINSALMEELDQLHGIGPVKAQAIVDSRPFGSVDDLIRVNGIGEITLQNIKSQGLACVAEEENKEDIDKDEKINANANNSSINNNNIIEGSAIKNSSSKIELEALSLNPQAIKSSGNSEISGKRDYAVYGLLAFGVLLGLLFLIKNLARKRYKNEFE